MDRPLKRMDTCYLQITGICMCDNYSREVVCGTGNLVLGTYPVESTSSVKFHLKKLTIPSQPHTLFLYLDRVGHPLPLSKLCALTLHATSYCKQNYQNRLEDLLPVCIWNTFRKRLIHDEVIMPFQYLEYEEYWPRLCQGHKPSQWLNTISYVHSKIPVLLLLRIHIFGSYKTA